VAQRRRKSPPVRGAAFLPRALLDCGARLENRGIVALIA